MSALFSELLTNVPLILIKQIPLVQSTSCGLSVLIHYGALSVITVYYLKQLYVFRPEKREEYVAKAMRMSINMCRQVSHIALVPPFRGNLNHLYPDSVIPTKRPPTNALAN